jgi:ubiquinone/menaquinone biosynthesis C-methylase UbiE
VDNQAAAGNTDQIEFWNGPAGAGWAALNNRLDIMLRPLGLAAMDRDPPAPGEHVLDIGCGCGDSTQELSKRVAPDGTVTGVDVSSVMLARARERAGDDKRQRFLNHDAASHTFDTPFDRAFSRFGVMFFDDPPAAFTNLARALKPGAPISFVCWREVADNAWVKVPMGVMRRHIEAPAEAPPSDAPGPFAFADGARVAAILEAAGFTDISIGAFDHTIQVGGPGTALDATDFFMQQGPASRLLNDADEAILSAIRADLAGELAPFERDGGVFLGAGCWLVGARAP